MVRSVPALLRGPALAAGLLAAAFAGAPGVATTDSPSSPAAPAALQAAHLELWGELAADARRAAATVGEPPSGGSSLARVFRRLEEVSSAAEPGARRTYLLVDPLGDIASWGGPGLLHAVAPQRSRGEPCGVAESAASVTLWCAEPLATRGAGQWTLVAGESFDRAGEAPVATGSRGDWSTTSWRVVAASGAPPRLLAEGVERRAPKLAQLRLARPLAGLLAVLLAALALIGGRPRAHRGRELLLAPAIALGSLAADASPHAATAVALATLAVLLPGPGATSGWRVVTSRMAAATIGPLLFLAPGWLGIGLAVGGGEALFGGPTIATLRLAAALAVLATIRLGAGATRAPRSEPGVGDQRADATGTAAMFGSSWLALSPVLAVGAALVETPWLVIALLAGAGAAGSIGYGLLGPRRPAAQAAAWIASALIAGSAATAADAIRERREAPALAARLLPPSGISMEERLGALEREIERVAAETFREMPPLSLPPSDLAYAVWRRSPLARGDARSALAIGRAGFAPSVFAFGLPVDDSGQLDPAPVRWVELDPSPWRAREVAGELDVEGAEGARWRVRWTLVPRPGFVDPAPALGDLARGLLRGGSGRDALVALPSGMRAVLYNTAGGRLVSPWSEGTPEFDPAWLAKGRPAPRVETPDGSARVVVASGEGAVAALFVPAGRSSGTLESVGSFAAGTLLLAAALGAAGLLVALGPAGCVRALRRLVRSYSQRLLLVFSALVLVPTVLLYALLASGLERRIEREQESRAREALHSAQRVLGEYVLSLDPGFGVDTALDDRLLEWLARVVRHEVNLYWGSEIYASSKRELFTSGLSPGRIPGEIWERIALAGEPIARRTASAGRHDYLELYAPLEVPGEEGRQSQLVLALPLLAQQEELAAEIARVRRRVLLGTLALFGLLAATGVALARSFARPIQELVDGTRRIADGAPGLGFRPGELELESLAEAIDRMASRIAEGRARLVAEKGLVERIVENVTAAVVGLDREGRVLLANRFARERLRAAPGEPLRDGLVRAGLGELATAFDAARPGVETVATEAPGSAARNWTLVRVPLEGSGDPAELVVVEDVTDVARAQRLEAWAAMARIIAHEIKNPLTPIRLSAEHLREAWARDREHFESVFERCTGNILAQVEELRRTASEFSIYAEIPRSVKERSLLGEIVGEVVDGYRAAPPPGVTIHYLGPSRPLEGEFDRRLVGRAVRNLIENALRAQPGGGVVEVEVGGENGFGFVRVADCGPGVAPELLGRILEPYFSTQAGGTGLGLPIARRVAAEHGGELSVRNRPQGGFEVTITIPLA